MVFYNTVSSNFTSRPALLALLLCRRNNELGRRCCTSAPRCESASGDRMTTGGIIDTVAVVFTRPSNRCNGISSADNISSRSSSTEDDDEECPSMLVYAVVLLDGCVVTTGIQHF